MTRFLFSLLSVLLIIILFTSCANTKKIVYFNNVKDATFAGSITEKDIPIKPNDILSITISSLNAEASAAFNLQNNYIGRATTVTGNNIEVGGYLVNADGTIELPILGTIQAAGFTKDQLKDNITNLILTKKLLVNPIVDIRYLNYEVTVLGEVAHPTVIPVPNEKISMREVVRRRYTRALKENLELPDLIIVDGGKGHISAVVDVLENELGLFIPVCGLAKDEKHRTSQLFMGHPPVEVPLARDSNEFYLLHRIQDEVHRFAITFHRATRGKNMLKSTLDDIPGVGEKRKKALLQHFGSIKKMKEATVEEFRKIGIGDKLAKEIIQHLRNQ